jgi:inhibitor of KinA
MTVHKFLDAGETALVVEFGTTVDPEINDRVLALDEQLTALALPGVRETVPTYRSLMVHYEPLVIDRERLIAAIRQIGERPASARKPKHRWTIPCCYDPPIGEDLNLMAENLGLDPSQVIALHSGAAYRAYMYGFAPGFCYLGGLPKQLDISRRATLRSPHPPNAILVAGGLTLIATFPMPTGWFVIGRTPERMFAPTREPNFLVEVGDALRFEPIDQQRFDDLERRAAGGEVVAKCERLR